MTAYRFTDPVDSATCVAHFGATPGIEHPGCLFRATVQPELDAYYCSACGRSGRIWGAWFLELLERHDPRPPEGVRLILHDGTEVEVDVLNTGTDRDGCTTWEVITDLDHREVAGMRVALFPARCSIRFPMRLPR